MRRLLTYPLLALLWGTFGSVAAGEQDKVYLQCRADPKYGDWETVIEIDKKARTIRMVSPFINASPLDNDDSDAYTSTVTFEGKVTSRLSVNRYTLRYSVYITLISNYFNEGQCREVDKKI